MRTTLLITVTLLVFATTAQPQSFTGLRNMGNVLNSPGDDQAPAMSPTGLALYFTSNRLRNLGQQDLGLSRRAALNLAVFRNSDPAWRTLRRQFVFPNAPWIEYGSPDASRL